MDGPKCLSLSLAGFDIYDESADLALVLSGFVSVFSADEAGNSKGKKKVIFAEKIEGGERVSLAEVDGSWCSKAECVYRDLVCGHECGLVGQAVAEGPSGSVLRFFSAGDWVGGDVGDDVWERIGLA